MWRSEMTLIGAVRNSLLYSAGDRCVGMGHAGMKLIGAVRNRVLYSAGNM
jgi:hypothetical protein